MTNSYFLDFAKKEVEKYAMEHLDKSETIPVFEVFIVWSCKTLQNHKALLSTTLHDGMYYECTYNGDRQPIKFCVNNNPSSNNRTLDCGAIRLPDLPRVNSSFLSAECYARQSVNNILRTGNSILGGKSSWYSVLKYYR